MKGYLIANLDVQDQPTFQRYRKKVVPRIMKYSGRYIIRSSEVQELRCRAWSVCARALAAMDGREGLKGRQLVKQCREGERRCRPPKVEQSPSR